MAIAKRNYLLIVEGSIMEPTIFNYVLPQYGFDVIKIQEQLSSDSDFTKMEFSDDKDTIFIVQGPKNRVKDLIETEVDLNSDSLSRKFFGPDVYFAGIFLIYDTDHNLKEQLEKAFLKFNDSSEGLLILSAPCIEALGEFDFDFIYEDKSFENYKTRLNQYYQDNYGMNTKEYIQCNFNKLILESLIRNKDSFEKENEEWDVNNVVLHPQYLLETYRKYNNCYGNCEDDYKVVIRYYATIIYVVIAYLKRLEREVSNLDILKKYLEEIEIKNYQLIMKYAKILVSNKITTLNEFIDLTKVDNLQARYLFLKFEEKGIISKRIKGEGRKLLIDEKNIDKFFEEN